MASRAKDPASLATAIYDRCLSDFPQDRLFHQQDLLGLGIIPNDDLSLLLTCTQVLVDQSLFRLLQTKDDRLAWKIIAQSDAEKLQNLSGEERLVYNVIHSTGRSGIWTKIIKSRTNLHQTIMNRCLKTLETRNYVKSVRNVKYPSRKIYMLSGLQPSEEITGGAWFTDGVLDADFIHGLSSWIEGWVSAKSWHAVGGEDKDTVKGKKRKFRPDDPDVQYIPYLPSYGKYPTGADITKAINEVGLTPVTMDEGSITQLLEMLCFDGKLVSLHDGAAYKAVRKPNQISLQRDLGLQANTVTDEKQEPVLGRNGMTEIPCGRCPVFTLCHPGGPVNPENCEYFDEWLKNAALSF
ncbi:34-kDa subunit of RNA polymerase III (C) [Myotisia sp. PD_48]|nr:34-kDa subunit of RNA polymerase III (C) [Myotisia sp. PD_48]